MFLVAKRHKGERGRGVQTFLNLYSIIENIAKSLYVFFQPTVFIMFIIRSNVATLFFKWFSPFNLHRRHIYMYIYIINNDGKRRRDSTIDD